MKQPLLILLALVFMGFVALDSYEFILKTQFEIQAAKANIQKTQMDTNTIAGETASLNKLKDELKTQRPKIYESELLVRQTVLDINYSSERSLLPQPQTTTKASGNYIADYMAEYDSQMSAYSTPKIISITDPDKCTKYCFESEYTNYLNLLYDYNSQATEINFKASQLGEPPVLLLEQYNPVLR